METLLTDCLDIIKRLADADSPPELLRRLQEGGHWKEAELFLYSEDLNSFFLLGDCSSDFHREIQQLFTCFVEKLGDISAFYPAPESVSQFFYNKMGLNSAVFPITFNNKRLGFCVFFSEAGCAPTGEEQVMMEIVSQVCGLVIARHYGAQENEKLSLENTIIKKTIANNENLKLLGEMIGSITHDFNNILTGVSGFAQLLQLSASDEDTLDSVMEVLNASGAGKRIVNFISRMKKVRADEEKKALNLIYTIKNAILQIKTYAIQVMPEADFEELIKVRAAFVQDLELPPVLTEELFMNVFLRLLKSGASKITVNINEMEDRILIHIRYSHGENKARLLPVKITDSDDFPSALLLYQLSDLLNFDFEVKKEEIILCFYSSKKVTANTLSEGFYGKRVLIFEPDALSAKLFDKIFNYSGADFQIIGSINDLKQILAEAPGKFDIIMADLSAFNLSLIHI